MISLTIQSKHRITGLRAINQMLRSMQPSELILSLSALSHRFTTLLPVLLMLLKMLKRLIPTLQLLPSKMPLPIISLLHQVLPHPNKATDLLLPHIVQLLPAIAPLLSTIAPLLLLIVQKYKATALLMPLIVLPSPAIAPPCKTIVQLHKAIVPRYRATAPPNRTIVQPLKPIALT